MPAKRKRKGSASAVKSSPVKSSSGISPSTSDINRFDENGDLTLIVDEEDKKREFLVCSRSLARSSPVFRQMLFGSFRESRSSQNGSDPWIVTLPEDSADVAYRLLSIVHGRFSDIPTTLSLPELLSTLIFTDKYDMAQSIRPWVNKWVPTWESWLKLLETPDYDTLVGIAWELGDATILEKLARRLIAESEVDEEGRLCYGNSGHLKPLDQPSMPLIPLDFLEKIQDVRKTIVTTIFERLTSMISNLQDICEGNMSGDIPRYCKNTSITSVESQMACHAITLGVTVTGLRQLEPNAFWNCESLAADYKSSVKFLIGEVGRIRSDLNESLGVGHSPACSPIPKLVHELKRLLASQPNPLTDNHLERMKTKVENLGIVWT